MADYANPDKLVSTDWAAQHLNNDGVRFIEVDVDTSAYGEGHLPGAVAWDWTSQLQDQVRRDVVDGATLQGLLRAAGVNAGTTVILYGDNNNWFAAYALWILEMYGVSNVKLMNGGRKKWLDEGRATTKDTPTHPPAGSMSVGVRDESIRAKAPDVLARLDGSAALVDVRSPDEYNGVIMAPPGLAETAQRKGHIPGAASIPWVQAVAEDGTFKSADDLRALYGGKGVDGSAPVIAYCRIGERSSHTWFVLRHLLGYQDVRNYDGSWTEWGSMVGMPVENPSA